MKNKENCSDTELLGLLLNVPLSNFDWAVKQHNTSLIVKLEFGYVDTLCNKYEPIKKPYPILTKEDFMYINQLFLPDFKTLSITNNMLIKTVDELWFLSPLILGCPIPNMPVTQDMLDKIHAEALKCDAEYRIKLEEYWEDYASKIKTGENSETRKLGKEAARITIINRGENK